MKQKDDHLCRSICVEQERAETLSLGQLSVLCLLLV